MLNGIPVIGANSAALPETIGSCGFVLDIPPDFMENPFWVPQAKDIKSWCDLVS